MSPIIKAILDDTPFIVGALLSKTDESSDGSPPEVRANALPHKLTRGNLLQIQAIFLDRLNGDPLRQNTIYLTIRDPTGRTVYPTSAMARHQSGMVIEIGTLEFPPGKYTIMVSNSTSLSPSDTATFEITGPELPENAPLLQPVGVQKTDVPKDADLKTRLSEFEHNVPIVPLLPSDRATAILTGKVRFVTELDRKVCPICQAFEGEVFTLDDIRKPDIPLHPNCRCHYEYVDAPPSSRKITLEEAEQRATRFRKR